MLQRFSKHMKKIFQTHCTLTIGLEIGLFVRPGIKVQGSSSKIIIRHSSNIRPNQTLSETNKLSVFKTKHDTILGNGFFTFHFNSVMPQIGHMCTFTVLHFPNFTPKNPTFSPLFMVVSTGSRPFLTLEWFEALGYLN